MLKVIVNLYNFLSFRKLFLSLTTSSCRQRHPQAYIRDVFSAIIPSHVALFVNFTKIVGSSAFPPWKKWGTVYPHSPPLATWQPFQCIVKSTDEKTMRGAYVYRNVLV